MSKLNNEVTNYINNVCSFVKNKKVHKEIKLELENHIQELTDDYISCGMSEEESLNKALLQMGPADVVGIDLNKVHKTNSDWMFLSITAALILFGLYTLSFIEKASLSNFNIVKRSGFILLISIPIALIFMKIDFRSIKKYSKYIYTFSIVLLILTHFTSPTINGVRNYLSIGGFSFKISDIASLLLIISLAG